MYTDEAFTLRAVAWQDRHLIVSLFTCKEGRLEAVAYGSRSSKGRVSQIYFHPLNCISVTFAAKQSTTGLRSLNECSFIELPLLVSDPLRQMYRQFVAELLVVILHEGCPQPNLWDLLRTYTSWLGHVRQGLYAGTLWLLVHFAEQLGIGLDIDHMSLNLKQANRALSPRDLSELAESILQLKEQKLEESNELIIQSALRLSVIEIVAQHLLESLGNAQPLRTLLYFAELKKQHRNSGSYQ